MSATCLIVWCTSTTARWAGQQLKHKDHLNFNPAVSCPAASRKVFTPFALP